MSAALPIGLLRHRLVLKRRSVSSDEDGGETANHAVVSRFWGRVTAGRTRLRLGWDTPDPVLSYDLLMRASDEIREGDVIVWRGLELDVLAVAPHPDDAAFLACLCSRPVVTA